MISTYEDYRTMPGSLALEEMRTLHREIKEEAGRDVDALELYKELLAAAVKYSESRASWPLWDREKKLAEDSVRTSRHNKVIDCFNRLARYLKSRGKPPHSVTCSGKRRSASVILHAILSLQKA